MASSNNIDALLRDILARINTNTGNSTSGNSGSGKSDSSSQACNFPLTPSQTLVIAGILGGVLDVDSVLVDRAQEVQIVLIGSLKQKTQLDKLMDQLGALPFDDVIKAIVGRLI